VFILSLHSIFQPEEKAAQKLRLEQEYLVRSAKRARKKKSAPLTDKPKKKSKGVRDRCTFDILGV
jgi:hypothetical protein